MPDSSGVVYGVPDGVKASTVDQTSSRVVENLTLKYENFLEFYTRTFDFSVGIGGSLPFSFKWKYDNTIGHIRNATMQGSHAVGSSIYEVVPYKLSAPPFFVRKMDESFQAALTQLPKSLETEGDKAMVNAFVGAYGTSFVNDITCGLRYDFFSLVDSKIFQNYSMDWVSTQMGLEFHYAAFDIDAGGFKNRSKIHVSNDFTKAAQTFSTYTGGDLHLQTNKTMAEWVQSVDGFPAALNYSVSDITVLVNDPSTKNMLAEVLKNYAKTSNLPKAIDAAAETLAALRGGVEQAKSPLPMVGVVGCGYDETTDEFGKLCMYDVSYDQGQSWTYPIDPSVSYTVPDGWYVQNEPESLDVNASQLFKSVNDWEVSHTTRESGGGLFRRWSKTTTTFRQQFFEQNRVLTRHSKTWSIAKVTAPLLPGFPKLAKSFTDIVDALPSEYNAQSRNEYIAFIKAAGTTAVTEVRMGAELSMDMYTNRCFLEQHSEEWVVKQSGWSFLDLISKFKKAISHDSKVDKDFYDDLVANSTIHGGSSSTYNISQWEEWAHSIPAHTVALLPMTVPIDELVKAYDATRGAALTTALVDYAKDSQLRAEQAEAQYKAHANTTLPKGCSKAQPREAAADEVEEAAKAAPLLDWANAAPPVPKLLADLAAKAALTCYPGMVDPINCPKPVPGGSGKGAAEASSSSSSSGPASGAASNRLPPLPTLMGVGYDPVTGTLRLPTMGFSYAQGKQFKETYTVPDQVDIAEVGLNQRDMRNTYVFQNTAEYVATYKTPPASSGSASRIGGMFSQKIPAMQAYNQMFAKGDAAVTVTQELRLMYNLTVPEAQHDQLVPDPILAQALDAAPDHWDEAFYGWLVRLWGAGTTMTASFGGILEQKTMVKKCVWSDDERGSGAGMSTADVAKQAQFDFDDSVDPGSAPKTRPPEYMKSRSVATLDIIGGDPTISDWRARVVTLETDPVQALFSYLPLYNVIPASDPKRAFVKQAIEMYLAQAIADEEAAAKAASDAEVAAFKASKTIVSGTTTTTFFSDSPTSASYDHCAHYGLKCTCNGCHGKTSCREVSCANTWTDTLAAGAFGVVYAIPDYGTSFTCERDADGYLTGTMHFTKGPSAGQSNIGQKTKCGCSEASYFSISRGVALFKVTSQCCTGCDQEAVADAKAGKDAFELICPCPGFDSANPLRDLVTSATATAPPISHSVSGGLSSGLGRGDFVPSATATAVASSIFTGAPGFARKLAPHARHHNPHHPQPMHV